MKSFCIHQGCQHQVCKQRLRTCQPALLRYAVGPSQKDESEDGWPFKEHVLRPSPATAMQEPCCVVSHLKSFDISMFTQTDLLGRVRWVWQFIRFQVGVLITPESNRTPDSIFHI